MRADMDEQYDKIYRYCYMKLKHRQVAEDVTQETFLRFLENNTYKDIGKEISYHLTIGQVIRNQNCLFLPLFWISFCHVLCRKNEVRHGNDGGYDRDFAAFADT